MIGESDISSDGGMPLRATSCHRALECVDIVEAVLDTLDPTCNRRDRAACVSSASVSRLFSEVALHLLWKELDCFFPLWGILLPSQDNLEEYFTTILSLKPYANPSVWMTFLTCAARVRSIRVVTGIYPLEDTFLQTLFAYNGGETFLPSLIAMYCRFGPHPPSPLVIAPRSLTTLSVHPRTSTEQYPDQLQAFMSRLTSSFPFLRTLNVLDDPRINTAGALLKDFRELRCLRHLNLKNGCGPLTPLDWQLVADSFCLETMDVSVAEFKDFVNYRIELPHLRHLKCVGYGGQLALFLTSARLLNLQSLTLSWFGTIPLTEFCSLFSIISSCLRHNSLRRLVLARRSKVEFIPHRMLALVQTSAESAGQLSLSDILRPCFAFRNLEDLAIRVRWKDEPINFTDDEFLSIARAFPYLRNFKVVLKPTSGLTAKSLVHVAQYCPRLVWLETLIDHLQPIASPGDDSPHYKPSSSYNHLHYDARAAQPFPS
ncbi:hypothetical protein C8Q74DRAFT_1308871 [Fomes fomentarius]|nr:hypothetical protein C8Q74DRAFT_1308871 [Fomes fomentarius]